ncbi:hypothetical protein BJ742DRAFT_416501 [Cladochytrium replicatum]|nr:hypothetical protein BJ742DRAFT_416501 [Cladochytrium replicatum]
MGVKRTNKTARIVLSSTDGGRDDDDAAPHTPKIQTPTKSSTRPTRAVQRTATQDDSSSEDLLNFDPRANDVFAETPRPKRLQKRQRISSDSIAAAAEDSDSISGTPSGGPRSRGRESNRGESLRKDKRGEEERSEKKRVVRTYGLRAQKGRADVMIPIGDGSDESGSDSIKKFRLRRESKIHSDEQEPQVDVEAKRRMGGKQAKKVLLSSEDENEERPLKRRRELKEVIADSDSADEPPPLRETSATMYGDESSGGTAEPSKKDGFETALFSSEESDAGRPEKTESDSGDESKTEEEGEEEEDTEKETAKIEDEDWESDVGFLADNVVISKRTRGRAGRSQSNFKRMIEKIKRDRTRATGTVNAPVVLSDSETEKSVTGKSPNTTPKRRRPKKDMSSGSSRINRINLSDDEDEMVDRDESDDSPDEPLIYGMPRKDDNELDENLSDFIDEEEGDETREALNEMPVEFRHVERSDQIKELVSFLVGIVIKPSFGTENVYAVDRFGREVNGDYDFMRHSIRSLDQLMTGYGNSLRTPSWWPEFYSAIETYPRLDSFMLDLHDFHYVTTDCEACHMTSHPATWKMELTGPKYDRRTMEMLGDDSDDDKDDDEAAIDGDDNEYIRRKRAVRGASAEFVLGKFCFSRASTFHPLYHYKYGFMEQIRRKMKRVYKRGLSRLDREDVVKRLTDDGFVKEMEAKYNNLIDRAQSEPKMTESFTG